MDVHRFGGKARLFLLGGVGTLVLTLLGFGLSISASSGTTTPGTVATSLGVYAGSGNISGINSLGQSIGAQPKYAMEFLDGTSWATISNPSYFLGEWQNTGYSMIWGVPMLPGSGASLAVGATGAYNQYFVTLAQAMVAGGQGNSIIRMGWEFNGGWFPWAANGQAANFVAYWQQIVTAMRSVPGANFQFEWNPTRGDLGVGNLADYYPGDAYVDLIGMDVYDTDWGTYTGATAEFNTMVTEPYGLDWLASFAGAHGKPITFPEWGLGWGASNAGGAVVAAGQQVSGGDDPTFINDMANWSATHNVLESTFWDYGTSSVAGGANPNTLAALAQDYGPGGGSTTTSTTSVPPTTTTTTTTNPAPYPVESTTSLAISQTSAGFGAEGTTQFTVTISPTLSGPVKVNAPWTVCTAAVTNGTGTCSLSNNNLTVGNYAVTAVYAGGGGVAGSTSTPVAFTVNPRPVVLSLSVTPNSVPFGSESSTTIGAQVTVPTGGIATGTVSVTSRSRSVCTITLSGGSGTCNPSDSDLNVGTDPLLGTYSGDGYDASTSAPATPLVILADSLWNNVWFNRSRSAVGRWLPSDAAAPSAMVGSAIRASSRSGSTTTRVTAAPAARVKLEQQGSANLGPAAVASTGSKVVTAPTTHSAPGSTTWVAIWSEWLDQAST